MRMNRRHLLSLLAGISVAGRGGVARPASGRIAVIGGGIIGASIAYHLATRGARVTVFEKAAPASAASGHSFAWINAHYRKLPDHYHRLSRLGVKSWHRLETELAGQIDIRWSGALEWYAPDDPADKLREQVRRVQNWGYPAHLVSRDEFAELESRVHPGPLGTAALSKPDGTVNAARATRVLLQQAQSAGAEVLYPCEVSDLDIQNQAVRGLETTRGYFDAERVVIAAGVGTPALAGLAGLEVPLVPDPGLLAFTRPQAPLLSRVVVSPGGHMKQNPDGRVVAGELAGPPDSTAHEILATRPGRFPDRTLEREHGQRILASVSKYLPALQTAQIDAVTIGFRPVPLDGYPVVGFSDSVSGAYTVVTHSGVTLAALLGQLVALEVFEGAQVELLAPYRPARFAGGSATHR